MLYILGLANQEGDIIAKLPKTIYHEIQLLQEKLYRKGITDGFVPLGDVYEIFEAAGYRRSTANKWLLNWAVSHRLKFEKAPQDSMDDYVIRTGEFYDLKPSELLDGGKVWLPVKEVYFGKKGDKAQAVLM